MKHDAFGQLGSRLMPAAAVQRIVEVTTHENGECSVTVELDDAGTARFEFKPGRAVECAYLEPGPPVQRATIIPCGG